MRLLASARPHQAGHGTGVEAMAELRRAPGGGAALSRLRPLPAGGLDALATHVLASMADPGPHGAERSSRTPGEGRAGTGRTRLTGGAGTVADDPGSLRVAALVELAQRGDAAAFGEIYELYVDTVYRYVFLRVGSRTLAEDLTAETFLRALRRLDTFSWQGRDIAAWFITIARNLITDHRRSSRFRLEVPTDEMLGAEQLSTAAGRAAPAPGPEQVVLDRARDRRLLEVLRTLRPDQQECLVLRFFQELSVAETARALGRSEGAVKQLQLRAVRTLAHRLGDEPL